MHEIHRICKKDDILKIRVPFYSSLGAFDNPTHIGFFYTVYFLFF